MALGFIGFKDLTGLDACSGGGGDGEDLAGGGGGEGLAGGEELYCLAGEVAAPAREGGDPPAANSASNSLLFSASVRGRGLSTGESEARRRESFQGFSSCFTDFVRFFLTGGD